ncbi:hypothetical protein QR680_003948 [Steinernema hermaphroditum]|uniref:Peptidase A1 domain-containing protein n=1 Tax=Steinernema hermaphroditum TaxID=289476 RepID=A0AA39HM68_9BILA|nr:hypothetical protein QR680_003948 [Steinernema hermaphroditum]
MLKWLLLCGFLCLASGNHFPLRVKRHLPQIKGDSPHYHHDPNDIDVLTMVYIVGTDDTPLPFIPDTTSADIELTLCTSLNYPDNCYDYMESDDFVQIDEHTASDRFIDTNDMEQIWTFITRKPVTPAPGSIGFGFPALQKYPHDTYWPDAYVNNSLEAKTLTMHITQKGCTGVASYGTNQICYIRNFHDNYTFYLPTTSKLYWQFAMDSVQIGKVKTTTGGHAVIATNKEYIGMPKKFLQQFAQAYGIQWDGLYGAYTVECKRNLTLPDLQISVADGNTIKIKATEYVYTWETLPNGMCVLNFEDSKAFGFGPEWYFGIQLLESYCVTLDFDKKQMSFTKNFWILNPHYDPCPH